VRRAELEHLVRAACELNGDDEIIVIGSQAIHASFPEDKLPGPTTLSNEADLWPIGADDEHDPRIAQIEGALGEDSPFHRTHRVYGDGVDATSATLPPGWEARLVRFESANTNGKVGLCLERHDLCIAKLVAGRPKDLAFIDSLLRAHPSRRHRPLAPDVLTRSSTSCSAGHRQRAVVPRLLCTNRPMTLGQEGGETCSLQENQSWKRRAAA